MLLSEVAARLDALADELRETMPLGRKRADAQRLRVDELRRLAGELRSPPHPFVAKVTQGGGVTCLECSRPEQADCHQMVRQLLPAPGDRGADWQVFERAAAVHAELMTPALLSNVVPITDGDGLRRQAAMERQLDGHPVGAEPIGGGWRPPAGEGA